MPQDTTALSCQDRGQSCQPLQASGKAPFLCGPYMAGDNGRYEPSQTIDRCPVAVGGARCRIQKHSFRQRKTGPEIDLRILYCKEHRRHFTVYPVGHVPYGRCALAAVDLLGEVIQRTEPEPVASCRGCLFRGGVGCGHRPPVAG